MRVLLIATLGVAAMLVSVGSSAQAPAARDLHFAFDLGVTGGGDKLATVTFNDGSTETIRAGGLVQVGTGLLWQPSGGPVALQATVNYHTDQVNARNGSLRFERYPIEVLGFYTGLPGWRFGAGPRFVINPRLKADFPGDNSETRFDDTLGAVAEVGYQIGRFIWVNVRLTAETYKVKSIDGTGVTSSSSISGNSIGTNVVFHF